MKHVALTIAAFLAGFCLALVVRSAWAGASPDQGLLNPSLSPTVTMITATVTATQTPAPKSTLAPAVVTPDLINPTLTPGPGDGQSFGWVDQVQCYNCTPFSAKVKLSSYNPTSFDPEYPKLNCWLYSADAKYCLSPTWIGVPWEAVWGYGAACPEEWPIGTWIDIDQVGYFVCFDHGDAVKCVDGVCQVDIMGPGGADWDGQTYEATLWVPPSYLLRLAERNKEK